MPQVKPLRRSVPFLRPYTGRILFALVCLGIAALAALAMPVSIRLVVDYGFSNENGQYIDIYFIALLLLSVIYALSSSLRYYTVMWIGERVVADIRSAVYNHVIKMDPTFFEVTKSGEVLSRLTTDTTLVQSVVGAGVFHCPAQRIYPGGQPDNVVRYQSPAGHTAVRIIARCGVAHLDLRKKSEKVVPGNTGSGCRFQRDCRRDFKCDTGGPGIHHGVIAKPGVSATPWSIPSTQRDDAFPLGRCCPALSYYARSAP